jgi:hypothetical protein
MPTRQVSIGQVCIFVEVPGELICVFGPLGATEIAIRVISLMAVFSNTKVTPTESEEAILFEMLHCIIFILKR